MDQLRLLCQFPPENINKIHQISEKLPKIFTLTYFFLLFLEFFLSTASIVIFLWLFASKSNFQNYNRKTIKRQVLFFQEKLLKVRLVNNNSSI